MTAFPTPGNSIKLLLLLSLPFKLFTTAGGGLFRKSRLCDPTRPTNTFNTFAIPWPFATLHSSISWDWFNFKSVHSWLL